MRAQVSFLLAACYELASVKATRVVRRDLSVFRLEADAVVPIARLCREVVAVINVFVRTNFQPTAVTLQRVLLRITNLNSRGRCYPGILTSIRANRPSNIMKNSLGCFFVAT